MVRSTDLGRTSPIYMSLSDLFNLRMYTQSKLSRLCWLKSWRKRVNDNCKNKALVDTDFALCAQFKLWCPRTMRKAPSTPATTSKQQATLSKLRSTLSKQHSTLLPQTATMSNEYRKISSFRHSRNKLNMFNLFGLCRKDEISFDNVAETGNIVAKNGNNVEATFDIVERIVHVVAFDNVASTLLLVSTGL